MEIDQEMKEVIKEIKEDLYGLYEKKIDGYEEKYGDDHFAFSLSLLHTFYISSFMLEFMKRDISLDDAILLMDELNQGIKNELKKGHQ